MTEPAHGESPDRLPRPELTYPIAGQLAVANGMIDEDGLRATISRYRECQNSASPRPFESILAEDAGLDEAARDRLFTATIRSLGRRFVGAAKSLLFIDEREAESVLREQADGYRNGSLTTVADLLVGKGILTESQRETVYAHLLHPEHRAGQEARDREIGNLAVSARMLTAAELDSALREREALPAPLSLEAHLSRTGRLSRPQLRHLHTLLLYIRTRKADEMFCRLAVMHHLMQPEDGMSALAKQETLFRAHQRVIPAGPLLVKDGILHESAMRRILREQGRIRDVVAPPELPSRPLRLDLSEDGLRAWVTREDTAPVDPGHLLKLLAESGVTHGRIPEGQLFEWAESTLPSLVVATGTPPTLPVDARLRLFFSPDYLRAGTVGEDGEIDYFERGSVPFVTTGTPLAERVPPLSGVPGLSVTGAPIPPPAPLDISPIPGTGARLSEDGETVLADADGRPQVSLGGEVSVCPEIQIPGDVDPRTGHVRFAGHVKIRGRVAPGFEVEAASAEIGEVDGAVIRVRGNLVVHGGVTHAKIRAGGGITAGFVSGSDLMAFDDIRIAREVRNSKIATSHQFRMPAGKLLESQVAARGGLEIGTIGNGVAEPNRIEMGTRRHVERTAREIAGRCDQRVAEIAELQKEFERDCGASDTSSRCRSLLTAIEEKIETIERERRERQALLDWATRNPGNPGNPELRVRGCVDEGTTLKSPDALMETHGIEANRTFRECRYQNDTGSTEHAIRVLKGDGKPTPKG